MIEQNRNKEEIKQKEEIKVDNKQNSKYNKDVIEEPTVDELIEQITKEKEEQIQNLTMQLYDKQHENDYLKKTIQNQEKNFNNIVIRLVISLLGDK